MVPNGFKEKDTFYCKTYWPPSHLKDLTFNINQLGKYRVS